MPALSSVSPALPTVLPSCSNTAPLPSPEEIRSMFAQAVETVMSNHENFHAAAHFIRSTRKLPLDRLTDFIFSLQSQNLPIQIASYSDFCKENQFANSTLSEARSKIDSAFFKMIFDEFMILLTQSGAFNNQKYAYP